MSASFEPEDVWMVYGWVIVFLSPPEAWAAGLAGLGFVIRAAWPPSVRQIEGGGYDS